jgi:SnoaL-like domain
MAKLEKVLLAYVAAWNEGDEVKRRALLEIGWTDEGVYSDPMAEVTGREALVQHIGRILRQFAGSRIILTSGVDEHHGRIRFTWARVSPNGGKARGGIDFGELGADGRLARITGFFGDPVAIPSSWPEDMVR